MPTLAGSKHLSVHFFPHGPRLFHPSTEKIAVRSVRNGHQSGYGRANIQKRKHKQNNKDICIQGINTIIEVKN